MNNENIKCRVYQKKGRFTGSGCGLLYVPVEIERPKEGKTYLGIKNFSEKWEFNGEFNMNKRFLDGIGAKDSKIGKFYREKELTRSQLRSLRQGFCPICHKSQEFVGHWNDGEYQTQWQVNSNAEGGFIRTTLYSCDHLSNCFDQNDFSLFMKTGKMP